MLKDLRGAGNLVRGLSNAIETPVTCKIRILDS